MMALQLPGWAYTAEEYDESIARWQQMLTRDQTMLSKLETVYNTATGNISIEQSNINILETQFQSGRIAYDQKMANYRSNIAICKQNEAKGGIDLATVRYWQDKEGEIEAYAGQLQRIYDDASAKYTKLRDEYSKKLLSYQFDQQEFKDNIEKAKSQIAEERGAISKLRQDKLVDSINSMKQQ